MKVVIKKTEGVKRQKKPRVTRKNLMEWCEAQKGNPKFRSGVSSLEIRFKLGFGGKGRIKKQELQDWANKELNDEIYFARGNSRRSDKRHAHDSVGFYNSLLSHFQLERVREEY